MKKLVVMLFACLLALVMLCSCGNEKDFVFSADYLKAVDGENEIVIAPNTHLEIADGKVSVRSFGSDEIAITEGNYKIANVAIGDSYSDFADAFCLKTNGAMWETLLYVNERENVYNYPAYEKKAIDFDAYDDVFLTVGFYTDKEGNWNTFDAATLKNVWNLEADEKKEAEIVDICIIAAGLDSNGVINGLFLDYGKYADFEVLENYEVNVDYFPQESDAEDSAVLVDPAYDEVKIQAENADTSVEEAQNEEVQTEEVQTEEVQTEELTADRTLNR